jgi:hypothetical protein
MTEQTEMLMTDEGRKFKLDFQKLSCPCGRPAVMERRKHGNTIQFRIHCETGELYRKICQIKRVDMQLCPDTGWHPSSKQTIAVWKAVRTLSK